MWSTLNNWKWVMTEDQARLTWPWEDGRGDIDGLGVWNTFQMNLFNSEVSSDENQ